VTAVQGAVGLDWYRFLLVNSEPAGFERVM
jgi:hypothetical protein